MSRPDYSELFIEQAASSDGKSKTEKWKTCLWASKIVGTYSSKTGEMATRMGVSPDTIEDNAHTYKIFEELITAHDNQYRQVVFWARRAPYIRPAHFRVLYEAWTRYGLDIDQVFQYLLDVIQAEGGLSARALEQQLKDKHDVELDWRWFAAGVLKSVDAALKQPTLPDRMRRQLNHVKESIAKEINQ